MFINLDEFAELTKCWVGTPARILEVGCGEGAMTERLARVYPAAAVTAIDITPKIGRLYRGEPSRVSFSQETVEDVARRQPASFDLVILADVLHHVPPSARRPLLMAIDEALVPGGTLVVKDWLISTHPIHWLCLSIERYITGDDVVYFTSDGIEMLLTSVFGPASVLKFRNIHPWKNNVAALVQRRP